MDITDEISEIIKQGKSSIIEYKAVLPPARNIAQMICSFANTEGGYIVLGALQNHLGKIDVTGLSEDFHANSITHKALDLISPQPQVHYQYVIFKGKKIYVIKVEKGEVSLSIEGQIYVRIDRAIKQINATQILFKANGYGRIRLINQTLETYKKESTISKIKLLEHFQSILKIIDDLGSILYPIDVDSPSSNQEGKILSRILFSSFVDNFETYLSELLYEIFLANPATLKSQQPVTIEEVLNCSDLQEFVKYWAKVKIGKLQKGSVKGFIKENKQINDLGVLDDAIQNDIEKILQIRHLYSHRNGIVDEKFLQYFTGQFLLNSEHQMSIAGICDSLCYLAKIVDLIDLAAIGKYNLA